MGERVAHNRCDLKNKRFGHLVACYPTGETRNRSCVWHCECDCGNTVEATARNLNRHAVKSCGCLRHRSPDDSHSIKQNLHFVDGTCIEHLISSRERPITNRTGVRGVYLQRRSGCYVAYIGFQGKSHYLGRFDTLPEAAAARYKAEQTMHMPLLSAYFKDLAKQE